MRIFVHDYAGHPFQLQLSQALADRNHQVLHAYCASLNTTPQVFTDSQNRHTSNLQLNGLKLDTPVQKRSFVKRWWQENRYGKLLTEAARAFDPEVILSANTPLDAQKHLLSAVEDTPTKFAYWTQDLIGPITATLLAEKLPGVGHAIGWYYRWMEGHLLRRSDRVILASPDFCSYAESQSVDSNRVSVIPNWSPIEEFEILPKDNEWARQRDLHNTNCLLYAGTLGMKHNPELLLNLAQAIEKRDDTVVLVVSQGEGVDWLERKKNELELQSLQLLPFQPYEDLPKVLATGDILIGMVTPEASQYSVPSKVLTYLCAGRPVVVSIPRETHLARVLTEHQAGRVADPGEPNSFRRTVVNLLEEPREREQLAENARRYAEEAFDIHHITNQFEKVLAPQH